MNEVGTTDQQQRWDGNVMDQPMMVEVPQPGLLDKKLDVSRLNPSFLATCFSTLLAATLLGLCFVIVGIPPLHISNEKGKHVYVGVMIPLLTVFSTVLSYYAVQHHQRLFNSAVMKIVKEIELHAVHLKTAVGNVEAELQALGAHSNLEAVGGEPARACRPLMTPEEPRLQRSPSGSAHGGAATVVLATGSAIEGLRFLHGINRLEENRDTVIATVHVGKEWQWLMELLGKLGALNLTGSTNPVLQYQRAAVSALAISIARVERMILTLYFSSLLLQRAKAMASFHRGGLDLTMRVEGSGAVPHNRTGGNQCHAGSHTATSTLRTLAPAIPSQKLRILHTVRAERGASLESAFTPPRGTPKGSRGGVDDGGAGGATASCLTAGQGTVFFREEDLELLQFSPLLGGSGAGEGQTQGQQGWHGHQASFLAAAAPSVSGESAFELDPDTHSMGAQEDTRLVNGGLHHHPASRRTARSLADVEKVGDVNHLDEFNSADRTLAGFHRTQGSLDTLTPSRAHSVTRELRGPTGASSGNAIENEVALSPTSDTLSSWPKIAPASPGGGGHGSMRRRSVASPDADESDTRTAQIASPLSKPRRASGPRRRRPGSAIVASPTLTIYRGARFAGDEDNVFATLRIHVRGADSTYSSRLYGALAHVAYDASLDRHYFINRGDSSLSGFCTFKPFTFFHASNHEEQREGLKVLEQRLLRLAYCRPEEHLEEDPSSNIRKMDLSSLLVRGTESDSGDEAAAAAAAAAAAVPATEPPAHASLPECTSNSSCVPVTTGQCVDSVIIAMQLLDDRPMRLTFLPVLIEPLPCEGTRLTHSHATPHSITASPHAQFPIDKKKLHRASGGPCGFEDGATNSASEALAQAPGPKTVPVLECVVDDVLCILTQLEITIDASFERPRKVLLIGVSVEDTSEEGSDRGDTDLDVDEHDPMTRDVFESRSGDASRDGACATRPPTDRCSSPHRGKPHTAAEALQNSTMAMKTAGGESMALRASPGPGPFPSSHTTHCRCTLGQEFREVIYLE